MSCLRRIGQLLSIVMVLSLTFGSFGAVGMAAEDNTNKDVKEEPNKQKEPSKKEPMRVDDLPKPIPNALKKMKEVGDDVGDAITRGAGKVGRATKKAIEGDGK